MKIKKRILITGASSSVGTALRPYLREDYLLRLHYRRRPVESLVGDEEAVQADIEDFDAVQGLFHGVDAVIHLAGEARVRATWEQVRGPNLQGAYNVFEAARRAGVMKIVFASTAHVTGMYDREQAWPVEPSQPPRPDSLYGVSKVFGEALARYYADAFNMSIICLRIGWVLERPRSEREMRVWLSPRDSAQLHRLGLETNVRFGIYYGVSNNTRNVWSIENARLELGYDPQDDSEVFVPQDSPNT